MLALLAKSLALNASNASIVITTTYFKVMSTLVSTRIKDPLLKEVEEITNATDLGIADLLRLGLRRVVAEFRETGGIRIVTASTSRTEQGRAL